MRRRRRPLLPSGPRQSVNVRLARRNGRLLSVPGRRPGGSVSGRRPGSVRRRRRRFSVLRQGKPGLRPPHRPHGTHRRPPPQGPPPRAPRHRRTHRTAQTPTRLGNPRPHLTPDGPPPRGFVRARNDPAVRAAGGLEARAPAELCGLQPEVSCDREAHGSHARRDQRELADPFRMTAHVERGHLGTGTTREQVHPVEAKMLAQGLDVVDEAVTAAGGDVLWCRGPAGVPEVQHDRLPMSGRPSRSPR